MANRYWVGGNANWDNTAGTKWSTTSGGAGGAAVPTSADDVFFDANSGAVTCTLTIAGQCLSINFTGFTGTFAGTGALQYRAGGCNLGSTATFTCTGNLNPQASSTITSNGSTWNGGFTNGVAGITMTLADDLRINGTLAVSSNGICLGNKFMCYGNVSIGTWGTTSTTNVDALGSGTFSIASDASSTNYYINGNYTVNATTALSGSNSRNFQVAGGTFNASGQSLRFSSTGTMNIYLGAATVGDVRFGISNAGGTYNILENFTCDTLLIGSGGTFNSTLNSNNIYVTSGLTLTATTATLSGTTTIHLTGTQTLLAQNFTTGTFRNNLVFNSGANTITLSGTLRYQSGTITYTSGTINAGTSTLVIPAACTLNTNGMSWNNITISGTTTVTLNSLLSVLATLALASGSVVTFTGTAGWSVHTFDIQTSNNITHTLEAGITYTITNVFNSTSTTNALKDTLASSSGVTRAILTLNPTATQNVAYTNATRIDSSLGQTIYSFNAILTDTLNWGVLNADLIGSGIFTFVN